MHAHTSHASSLSHMMLVRLVRVYSWTYGAVTGRWQLCILSSVSHVLPRRMRAPLLQSWHRPQSAVVRCRRSGCFSLASYSLFGELLATLCH